MKIDRRKMLKTIGLTAIFSGLELPKLVSAQESQQSNEKRPWFDLGIIGDPIMDNQLLWYLSAAWQGTADIGECLDTASRINAQDENSWPREWLLTAERVRRIAEKSENSGHKLSAGDAYLRAANYYRACLIHHPDPKDPSVLAIGYKSVECYDKALALLDIPAQAVRIPYENTTLRGYFFRSPIAKSSTPILIFHQGRDAWPEESKYLVDGALKRGYHALIFHGPGQGMAIREQKLPFRPDWEKVVTPVIDFAINLPGVDRNAIILMGASFGGALAPRAAAFDQRIKICIANPGVLNWGEAMRQAFGAFASEDLVKLLDANPQAFDQNLFGLMQEVPLIKWYLNDAMNKHGAKTPSNLFKIVDQFDNTPIVDKITCKVLVMDGEAESFSVGQAKKLFDALKSPKDYMLFTAEDTGLVHVQTGALAVATQRMFDWLDENI